MVNVAIILGNLGSDPEVKFTAQGKAVANLSVATTEKWKGQDGQYQESTEWHRIQVWGKLAELCGEYLSKGSKVYVQGKIKTSKYKDQNGTDRYQTSIVANEIKFLSPRQQGGGSGESYGGGGYTEPPDMGADIPF